MARWQEACERKLLGLPHTPCVGPGLETQRRLQQLAAGTSAHPKYRAGARSCCAQVGGSSRRCNTNSRLWAGRRLAVAVDAERAQAQGLQLDEAAGVRLVVEALWQ